MVITGAQGAVRWGFHTASLVRAWTLTRGDNGVWALSATVESVNTFRVTQRPLVFVAANQHWPVTELQITGASLSATLGPQE